LEKHPAQRGALVHRAGTRRSLDITRITRDRAIFGASLRSASAATRAPDAADRPGLTLDVAE